MSTETIIAAVSIFITFLIIGIFIFLLYRKNKNIRLAKIFLYQHKADISGIMMQVVKDFDYSKYNNIGDINIIIIDKLIYESRRFINLLINTNESNLTSGVLKILSETFINNYIDSIIQEFDVLNFIEMQIGPEYQKMLENEILPEEEALNKEYSNKELYYSDESDVKLSTFDDVKEELPESDDDWKTQRGFKKDSKKDIQNINPQTDEEEQFNDQDSSMEIIE